MFLMSLTLIWIWQVCNIVINSSVSTSVCYKHFPGVYSANCWNTRRIASTYQYTKIRLAIGKVPGSGNSMNTYQMCQQVNVQWQPVMNNPSIPYAVLQTTSGQQVPTN
jgi:hypothetical protein